MLVKADASQLEWRVAAFLSQDPVAIQEIVEGLDTHELNRQAFNLDARRTAKIFLFRLIYGGSAYSYAKDPDFMHLGGEKFWQEVIDKTYGKYLGLGRWHNSLVEEVMRTGQVVIPSGRVYKFSREGKDLPRTKILNYPVQGLSADIMNLVRVAAWNKLKGDERIKFIATVHDDIRLDVDNDPNLIYNICHTFENIFQSIPEYFTKYFKVQYNVPMAGEVLFGRDLGNTVTFNKESFNADYSDQCIPR